MFHLRSGRSAHKRWRAARFLESLESRLMLTTTTFAVVGDYGIAGTPEANVATLIHGWNPDFVITTGDNNYSTGSASTIDPNIGQYYHDYIGNYTGGYGAGASPHNRFFPSLGNHDWGNVVPGNAQPYFDYFTLPGTPTGTTDFRLASPNPNIAGNERYYTYAWGPVQFFAIDSDKSEPDGYTSSSTQATWLHNALTNSLADSSIRWRIVYFHHAAYSSGNSHGNNAWMQWPFAEWGASVVMSGHDHTYERISNPSDGLTYFVEGTGGNTLNGFITTPVAGSQVRYASDYGAMKVVASDTQITFQHITRAGTMIDTYTMNAPTAVPDAPTGLSVAVASSSQLNLSWTDNSTQDEGTRIERSADGVNFTQIAVVGANVTSYQSAGLSASTTYYYRVTAYNALGNSAYSNIASNTTPASTTITLLPAGAVWKYLDNGSDQGTAWRAVGFADSGWASGAAELGYNTDAADTADTQVTTVSYGPNASTKYTTTYFRNTFSVVSPGAFTGLTLNILRDDGAVVYINGTEVVRTNMPTGTILYSTFASGSIPNADEETFFTFAVSSSVLVAGTNTIAVEVHQSNLTSTDLGFNLSLIGSTAAPAPPTGLSATTASTTQINLAWTDNSADETGFKIERSTDGVSFGTVTTTAANVSTYSDTGRAANTRYYYRVRAVNGAVESTATSVASAKTYAAVSLVAMGASWKYLDNGTNQGTAWIQPGFNDSGWSSGNAELGYGDGGEATVLGYGPDANNKYTTYYFRKTFTAGDVSQISSLVLSLVRDDGAIVYLNGTEIARSNMPGGTVTSSTFASSVVGGTAELQIFTFNVSPSVLINGSNTLAVEIHQSDLTSSDISFNLGLVGAVAPAATPTNLAANPAVSGGLVTLSWNDVAATETGYRLERSSDGVNFSTLATLAANSTSYPDSTVAVNSVYTYRVFATNANGDSASSNNAAVEVEEAIISGLVFDDADNDATQDPGEFGLGGWTVYLDRDSSGTLTAGDSSVVTNNVGEWAIGEIFGGSYTVRIVPQGGWNLTKPAGSSYAVSVDNSANANAKDFGEFPPTSIAGSGGADTYAIDTLSGTHVRVWVNAPTSGNPTYLYALSAISGLTVDGGGGDDSLTLANTPSKPVTFNGGTGNDSLTVDGGTYTFSADAQAGTASLTVNVHAGAGVIFNTTQHLAALDITDGTATMVAGANKVLFTKALSFAATGTLDLNDNDMIVDYTGHTSPRAAIELAARAGYNGGNWLGAGLRSTKASENSGTYTLGVLDNAQRPTPFTTFDNVPVPTTVVLVKYTYVADLDLDGIVSSNDAIVLANNYAEGATARHQLGDTNYNGVFDSNDAILFANTYNESLPLISGPNGAQAALMPAVTGSATATAIDSTKTTTISSTTPSTADDAGKKPHKPKNVAVSLTSSTGGWFAKGKKATRPLW